MDRFNFRSLGRELRPDLPPPPPDPHPAPVVGYLTWARRLQKDIDEKGWTFRQAARFHAISFPRVSQLLELTRLAPRPETNSARVSSSQGSSWNRTVMVLRLTAAMLD